MPDEPGGNLCVISKTPLSIVYVLAGIGQVHGKPYWAKYFGQFLAQSVQILSKVHEPKPSIHGALM